MDRLVAWCLALILSIVLHSMAIGELIGMARPGIGAPFGELLLGDENVSAISTATPVVSGTISAVAAIDTAALERSDSAATAERADAGSLAAIAPLDQAAKRAPIAPNTTAAMSGQRVLAANSVQPEKFARTEALTHAAATAPTDLPARASDHAETAQAPVDQIARPAPVVPDTAIPPSDHAQLSANSLRPEGAVENDAAENIAQNSTSEPVRREAVRDDAAQASPVGNEDRTPAAQSDSSSGQAADSAISVAAVEPQPIAPRDEATAVETPRQFGEPVPRDSLGGQLATEIRPDASTPSPHNDELPIEARPAEIYHHAKPIPTDDSAPLSPVEQSRLPAAAIAPGPPPSKARSSEPDGASIRVQPLTRPVVSENPTPIFGESTGQTSSLVAPQMHAGAGEASAAEQLRPVAPEAAVPAGQEAAVAPVLVPSRASPSGQIAMLEPGQIGRASPLERMRRFISEYDGGNCFFAAPRSLDSSIPHVDAFSSDRQPILNFREQFQRDLGVEPDVGERLVTGEQCPALSLFNILLKGNGPQLTVTIESETVKDGSELRGRIAGDQPGPVRLFIVDDDGKVQDISSRIEPTGEGLNFSVPVVAQGQGRFRNQLIVGLSSDRELAILRPGEMTSAAQFFTALFRNTKSAKAKIALGLGVFRVVDPL